MSKFLRIDSPNSSRSGCSKKFKLLKYEHIIDQSKSLDTHSGAIGESFRENLLIMSQNRNIFQNFKLNRILQRIPFKMMYNISMLRHRFSNERWGEGAP